MSLNKFDLHGGLVIVTGGAGLLGQQYCDAITEINGTPVVLDISPLRHSGTTHHAYGCDITKESDVLSVYKAINQSYSRPIFGLINNAAIDPKFEKDSAKPGSRLESYSLEQWQQELSVGLTGAFLCTKIFGAAMARQGMGSIINISSVLGHVAPNQALYKKEGVEDNEQSVKPVTYSVIKHGIIGLTRYTATYWGSHGIRCNALSPGGVFNNHSDAFVEKLSKYIPLGRMAQKNEYNAAIQFLLTDASSFMTGAVLQIDGGQTCW